MAETEKAKYTLWNSPPSEWGPPLGQPGQVVKLDIERIREEEKRKLEDCAHNNVREEWISIDVLCIDGNDIHSRVSRRFLYCSDCELHYEEFYDAGVMRRRTTFYDPKFERVKNIIRGSTS